MKALILLSLCLTAAHGLPSFNLSDTSVDLVAATWYAGWHAELFPLANVSWEKYTHITYSFAETTNNVSALDLSGSDPEMLPKFVKKAHQEGVKALVSIGGWTGGRFYSSNVASAENRTAFVETVTDLATKYHLDGIDFDWEYPAVQGIGCNTISPNDTSNFLSFLTELRSHPVGSQLILTAATPVTPWPDSEGNPANLTEFASLLDYVAVMNYDLWGSWSTSVGPNAPLNDTCASSKDQQGSAINAVQAWSDAGMPMYQIVLGVPSYGHSFTVNQSVALTNGTLNLYTPFEPEQPVGDAWDDQPGVDVCGAQTGYGGVWNFWGLVEGGFLKPDGSNQDNIHYRWDDCSQTPFVYNATSEIMISYDNPQSFQAKGGFIKSTGLRGFAAWEAAGDYKDVLLDAIRSGAGFEGPEEQC